MYESFPSTENYLQKFQQLEDKDEIDLSSTDLYEFPAELFKLPTQQLTILSLDYNNIETLPAEIGQLINLIELSLNGNELINIPTEIIELKSLEILTLNENRLCTFPEEVGELASLKQLSAIGNTLGKLPQSVSKLSNLEELYLDENQLYYLPTNFGKLTRLTTLEVCHNNINYLPDDIGDCCVLEVLSCGTNVLTKLPSSFVHLAKLRFLDLSNNKLTSLPDDDSVEITLLEKLYLENNTIEIIPSWISRLKFLEELTVSDNILCNEPFDKEFCGNLTNLRKLEAGTNFIATLAENIGSMDKLKLIHLGSTISELERSNFQNGNWIKKLPDSFCELKNLVSLNANENQIDKLPDMFGNLKLLTSLDLGQNMLEYLPASFTSLVNLEYLQLSKNQLKYLPDDMGRLKKLIEFRLDSNLLTEIPMSVGEITGMQALDVFHNRLKEIPRFIGNLRNLKRLDIDRNDFTLDLSKIPRLIPGVKYPKRDPALKDNWRGKLRADKYAPDEIQEIVIDAFDDDGGGEENEDDQWNENALRMALERGMSLWRSHSGPSTREVDGSRNQSKVDNDNWVAVTLNKNVSEEEKTCSIERDSNEEDWDEEIEEELVYKRAVPLVQDKQKRRKDEFLNILQRYPPSEQAFTQVACYDSFLYGKAILQQQYPKISGKSFIIVDGQFDNV